EDGPFFGVRRRFGRGDGFLRGRLRRGRAVAGRGAAAAPGKRRRAEQRHDRQRVRDSPPFVRRAVNALAPAHVASTFPPPTSAVSGGTGRGRARPPAWTPSTAAWERSSAELSSASESSPQR